MVSFNIGPLGQGQMEWPILYEVYILVLQFWDVKPTKISYHGKILLMLDLTLGPLFIRN